MHRRGVLSPLVGLSPCPFSGAREGRAICVIRLPGPKARIRYTSAVCKGGTTWLFGRGGASERPETGCGDGPTDRQQPRSHRQQHAGLCVTVVFCGTWAQATDLARTNVHGLQLEEVA